MSRRTRRFRRLFVCIIIVLLLVMNFPPTFGPPHFRYDGSDPNIDVWRIGWPIAMAQYDLRGSVHIGPFAVLLWPIELGVLGILAFGWSLNRWNQQRTKHPAACG